MSKRTVVMLCQPRTGSHMLGEIFRKNGYGKVGEIFGVEFFSEMSIWPKHYDDFVKFAKSRLDSRCSDEKRIIQIHAAQLRIIMKHLDIDNSEAARLLDDCFDNPFYFMLNRRDKVAQAVSFYFAMKTRQWSSFDKANNPTPPYSKEEIDQIIADEHDRSWVDIVKIRNLPVFYYEDLCDNINNVMDKLETLMRERFPLRSQNTLKKQESPEKESYIRRYRKESRDLIHH